MNIRNGFIKDDFEKSDWQFRNVSANAPSFLNFPTAGGKPGAQRNMQAPPPGSQQMPEIPEEMK